VRTLVAPWQLIALARLFLLEYYYVRMRMARKPARMGISDLAGYLGSGNRPALRARVVACPGQGVVDSGEAESW